VESHPGDTKHLDNKHEFLRLARSAEREGDLLAAGHYKQLAKQANDEFYWSMGYTPEIYSRFKALRAQLIRGVPVGLERIVDFENECFSAKISSAGVWFLSSLLRKWDQLESERLHHHQPLAPTPMPLDPPEDPDY